ncbi:MAG: hypothetical protein HY554_09720 [Elusimicrobia bacterium]|nr:hypothetical protein [Elusimicrobiota bacterium]
MMLEKSLVLALPAAVLMAGPGRLTVTAAALTMSRGSVTGPSALPAAGSRLVAPAAGASWVVLPGAPAAPNSPVASDGAVAALAVTPLVPAAGPSLAPAAEAMPLPARAAPRAMIQSGDAGTGTSEKGAALSELFENSGGAGQENLQALVPSARSGEESGRAGVPFLAYPAAVRPPAPGWRAKILPSSRYQGLAVKVEFAAGIAPENLLGTIGADGKVTSSPEGGRVAATLLAASRKKAAEIARSLAGYEFVEKVLVGRSVAWRLDEEERSPRSRDTRFERPELVGPAVAKLGELLSGVRRRGPGEYASKHGRRERLASVRVALAGRPQEDRVTLEIGRRWRRSDRRRSHRVTLIAGDRPAILVESKSGQGPWPRAGRVKWAGLSVGKTSVVLRLEAEDGSLASYQFERRPDGSVRFAESDYTGTLRATLR